MRKIFGQTVVKLAKKDSRIVLLTGDVEQEMTEYKSLFPDRFYNLGLCEQSIISIAAGMAIEGMRPIVYSITPFVIERPFEQVKVDIDEQNLPVILIGYSDYPTHGPTHQPLNPERLSFVWRNIRSFFPSSSDLAEKSIIESYLLGKPSMIYLRKDGSALL